MCAKTGAYAAHHVLERDFGIRRWVLRWTQLRLFELTQDVLLHSVNLLLLLGRHNWVVILRKFGLRILIAHNFRHLIISHDASTIFRASDRVW